MSDKDDALATFGEGYAAFRGLLAGLPDAAYREVWLGEWDLNRLLAHMAAWYREFLPAFDRVARGEHYKSPGADYSDADGWNARFAAQAKDGSAALTDLDAAFAAYRAAAAALPEGLFGTDSETGEPRPGSFLLSWGGAGHYEEHHPQVRGWLQSRKPAR